ncbi:hypothetical protein LJC26_04920 [Desulfovibrio sp. OttesenSCG-928-O18]|nr:hypothetical protein [Desulfovibrio sp. OttesenSCG-928-O18]
MKSTAARGVRITGRVLPFVFLLLLAVCPGCSPDETLLRNGYYSAVADSFNKGGWKEFVTIYVYNNKIVTAEYNARNASGLVLTWDSLSMREMKTRTRVHPNRIIRAYTQDLLTWQDPQRVRQVPGDIYFYEPFKRLATVAVEQARLGNKAVAVVRVTENIATSQ